MLRNCYDSALIVQANEPNSIGLIYLDVGYVVLPPVMAAIFGLTLTPMSKSIHTSSVMWAGLKIVGLAFEISLSSCIEAEILRYFIVISGNGCHFRFTTYPDVGERPH